MRLILLGPPGVGKGTQATFIRERFHIPQISTGEMLRKAISSDSQLGRQVKQIVESGHLVPDDIMIALVKERVQSEDCTNGFLLDGFPRTIPQAEALQENHIDLDYVIEIRVPDEKIIERLSGRRVHPESGRVYHIYFQPPKVQNVDDITGEPLIQRPDDHEETIRERLNVYHQQTEPLVGYYKNLAATQQRPRYIVVDGVGSVEAVKQKMFLLINP
ncbi:MAG: adenylate kinase [Gammaproteobacteria bacterium]|nr:adenylate kinase [Gammaproteobacteria bacterium]